MKRFLLLFLLVTLLLVGGCQQSLGGEDHSKQVKGDYQTSISDLEKVIRLPYKPRSVKWKLEKLGGVQREKSRIPDQNEYAIYAILVFDDTSIEEIKKKSGKPTEGGYYWEKEDFKKWYPPEVKKQFGKDDLFPDLFLLKAPYYNSKLFYKKPLSQGMFFFVDENTIFLNLYAT